MESKNMASQKIMLLFEFPSMNGGEHSMLACLKHLMQAQQSPTQFEFCAAGPTSGPLAEQLQQLNVPLAKFLTHDAAGNKYSPIQLQDQMQSLLNSVQPDVVHSNSLSMSRNVGRMSDEVFETTLRSGHLRDIMKLNRTAIHDLNCNDALIAVSNATRNFHVSQGLDPHKCQTIYNGVDTQTFAPAVDPTQRPACLNQLPEDAILVLNVGQICLRKGQLDLATAIVNLLPKHPELHLVMVGRRHSQKAESMRYETSIQKVFSDRGFADHLHCLGDRSQIQNLMNAADVLVHAAKQEPLGRVLLEAAACELPIIATDVGGTPEIVTHQQDAILVSPDVAGLQAGICRFLDAGDAAAVRANSAGKVARTRFSVDKAATPLAVFWSQLQRKSDPN